MKQWLTLALVLLLAGVSQPALVAHETAGTVKITIHYTGKGKVDASHKVWVWIFDTPQINGQSMPIDQAAIETNDTDAVFEGVGPSQVWVAAAFDEQGAMNGDGPPPSGTPIGILMKDGMPSPVTPGEKGTAVLTFNDAMRMQ